MPGDRIVLQRNENYWGEKAEWGKVTLKAIKSGPSRVAALLAGDVDLIEQTPTADIERLKGDPNLTLSQGISNRVIYLHLDHDRDASPFVKGKDGGDITNPLKEKRVRQAISTAINRDAIVVVTIQTRAIGMGEEHIIDVEVIAAREGLVVE